MSPVLALLVAIWTGPVVAMRGDNTNALSWPSVAVGRNSDGRLEVFRVDREGELRHRWQGKFPYEWSYWSSMGGPFLPGVGLGNDSAQGRLYVFAVDQISGEVEYNFQKDTNFSGWAGWTKLPGPAIQPPVAVELDAAGELEVFAVDAVSNRLLRARQVAQEEVWTSWEDMGATIEPGPVVARNLSGQLEVFGIDKETHHLKHCWQPDRGAPDQWSAWSDLQEPLQPGFAVGANADGRLEVVGVTAADATVVHAFQTVAQPEAAWSPWRTLGARMRPHIALGRNHDGRIEIFTVNPTNNMIYHTFQARPGVTTNWVGWTDMGAYTLSYPVVTPNSEGRLEIFAVDENRPGLLSHRRIILGNLSWTDWVSLEHSTAQYMARAWRIEEGLPDDRVQALAQTGDNYLWVGTAGGLVKFDGVRFSEPEGQAAATLSNSPITCLLVDRQQRLWVGTDGGGLTRLGAEPLHYSVAEGLAGNRLTCMCQARDDSFWFGTRTGLSHLRHGVFTNLGLGQGLVGESINALLEDAHGNLWVTTPQGLNRIEGDTIRTVSQGRNVRDPALRGMWQDIPERLWFGSERGLLHYRGGGFSAYGTDYGLADRFVNVVRADSKGFLWVGTDSGLQRFEDGVFLDEKDEHGARFGKVNVLFEDRERNVWAGTQNGLFRLTPKKLLVYDEQHGLARNRISAVLEDTGGSLWIGTWGGGLQKWKDQTIRSFTPANGFSNDVVSCLCRRRDGSIWAGSDSFGGLAEIKEGNVLLHHLSNATAATSIKVLFEDQAEALWVGANDRLACFKDGHFVTNELANLLRGRAVRDICEDTEGTLWVATDQGLARWQGGRLTSFSTNDGLSDNRLTALFLDEDHSLWIGTEGGGLNHYHGGQFSVCTSRKGLFSDEIFEMLEDDDGWLWMTCSRGVFRTRKADLEALESGRASSVTSIAIGRDDGMESVLCSAGKPGAWKGRDGLLWFPTAEGLVKIDPRAMQLNREPPPVCIEQVLADGQPLMKVNGKPRTSAAPGHLVQHPATEPLRIPRGLTSLEFQYTALSFQRPERMRFKYRLSPIDQNWVEASTRRAAYYNSLAPGAYTFQVRACNSDGIWNDEGASLELVMLPLFWERRSFQIAAGAAVISLIVLGVRQVSRRRIERKLQDMERRHAVEKERMRIARDIHDDLGGSLTQITLLGEMALRDLAKPRQAAEHVHKITNSARQTVRALDEIVWAIRPEHDRVDHLILYLWQFAEEFFGASSVRCRVEAPQELPTTPISAELRHRVYLVVKESFNNVLKHAAASEVRLRFSIEGGTLTIEIADNGKGLPAGSAKLFNDGLANMKQRVEEASGQFWVETAPGRGTQIRFAVPLRAAANGQSLAL